MSDVRNRPTMASMLAGKTPDPSDAINEFMWCMAKARSLGFTPRTEHVLAEHLFLRDAKVIFYSSMRGVVALVGDEDLFADDDDLLLLRLVAKRQRERARRRKVAHAVGQIARHFASAIEARSDATPQSDAAEGESATRQGDAR